MTVTLVRQAIRTFLERPTPEVLCIRGKWGVGKTYIWNDVLAQAKTERDVALPYYSYVSLFGLQTVDEVRQLVFENSLPTKEVGLYPSVESLNENLKRYAHAASKKISKYSQYAKLPYLDKYIANFSGGFRQIASLAVRDSIICFDDFERKKIGTKDLLGLVSQFREQRKCKVVIILNEDALQDDEKKEFWRYFEKVVDIAIEFAPKPDDCVEVAISETDFVNQKIKDNVVKLGISNIRIIHRVKNVARDLMRIIGRFDNEVKAQALHTLTLLIWSKFDDGAVPLGFVTDRGRHVRKVMGQEVETADNSRWEKILELYGFGVCDELGHL